MMKKIIIGVIFLFVTILGPGCGKQAGQNSINKDTIILATTTSTQDSGLLDVIIPEFKKKTGYKVKAVAVGTVQALKIGEKGEADVLLVHEPEAEKNTLVSGAIINRKLVMHNDFLIAGPATDPAEIKNKPVLL